MPRPGLDLEALERTGLINAGANKARRAIDLDPHVVKQMRAATAALDLADVTDIAHIHAARTHTSPPPFVIAPWARSTGRRPRKLGFRAFVIERLFEGAPESMSDQAMSRLHLLCNKSFRATVDAEFGSALACTISDPENRPVAHFDLDRAIGAADFADPASIGYALTYALAPIKTANADETDREIAGLIAAKLAAWVLLADMRALERSLQALGWHALVSIAIDTNQDCSPTLIHQEIEDMAKEVMRRWASRRPGIPAQPGSLTSFGSPVLWPAEAQ